VGVNVTVVPCTQNFESQNPQPVTLQFVIINEFEQQLSASTSFRCWQSYNLEDISSAFLPSTIGGNTLQTRMRTFASPPNAEGVAGGIMAVIEETHIQCPSGSGCEDDDSDGVRTFVSRAAQNAHTTFIDQTTADIITIPAGQIGPGQP